MQFLAKYTELCSHRDSCRSGIALMFIMSLLAVFMLTQYFKGDNELQEQIEMTSPFVTQVRL